LSSLGTARHPFRYSKVGLSRTQISQQSSQRKYTANSVRSVATGSGWPQSGHFGSGRRVGARRRATGRSMGVRPAYWSAQAHAVQKRTHLSRYMRLDRLRPVRIWVLRTNRPQSTLIGLGRVIPIKRGGLQGFALDGENRVAGVAPTHEDGVRDLRHAH